MLQRTIDAIVREARRPVRTDLPARADAVATVRERAGHWRPWRTTRAADDDRRLHDGPLLVALAADDLADLVDVLVDNVFAHTAEPTGFAVRLERRGTAQARGRRRGRRRRVPRGEDRTGTTGLGPRHRAAYGRLRAAGGVTLGPRPGGGTRVEVVLPLAAD